MLTMKNGKLLIDPITEEAESKNGLIYTNDQRHKSFKGRIIATDSESGYEVGDIAVFSEFAGEKVYVGDRECLIISSEDVWGLYDN